MPSRFRIRLDPLNVRLPRVAFTNNDDAMLLFSPAMRSIPLSGRGGLARVGHWKPVAPVHLQR